MGQIYITQTNNHLGMSTSLMWLSQAEKGFLTS